MKTNGQGSIMDAMGKRDIWYDDNTRGLKKNIRDAKFFS